MASSSGDRSKPTQRKRRALTQPPMTDEYLVEDNDTLFSIAVAFGCPTSELRRLNRLQTSLVFPGQLLFVPSRGDSAPAKGAQVSMPAGESPSLEQSVPHPVAARPTVQHEITVELAGEALMDDDDAELGTVEACDLEHSIQCRYVTRGVEGVVPGILAVTPRDFNFCPDPNHILVAERGAKVFSVILPVEHVSSLGIYDNFSQMKIKDPPTPSGSQSACGGEGFLFCSSAEWEKCRHAGTRPLAGPVPVLDARLPGQTVPQLEAEEARNALDTPSPQPGDTHQDLPGRTIPATVASVTSSQSTAESSTFSQRMQPISQPVSILSPKSTAHQDYAERPAEKILPRFLCIRTQPLTPLVPAKAGKPEYWFAIPYDEITPLYDYLQRCCPSLQAVNHRALTETLDSFVLINSFAIEEGLDIVEDFFSASEARGWVLPPSGMTEVDGHKFEFRKARKKINGSKQVPGGVLRSPSNTSTSRRDPMAAAGEEPRQPRAPSFTRGQSFDLPNMLDESQILSYDHLCKLAHHLPNSVVGCSWKLAYGTDVHGISLRTMYRNMRDLEGPILLAVRDTADHIFGVLSSTQFRVSDKFLGNGHCFLYTFHDSLNLEIFTWTGENDFFVKGDPDSLCFGSGE